MRYIKMSVVFVALLLVISDYSVQVALAGEKAKARQPVFSKTFRDGDVVIGGRRGRPPLQPYRLFLPRLIKVTDIYVYAHDQWGNVTKAILRVQANDTKGAVFIPDWQDVKKAKSTLYYRSADNRGWTEASSLVFTSQHKGFNDGGDETVLLNVKVYGY